MGWRSYLGLPHRFAADPRDGQGCDCLVMVFNVLDDLGVPHPPMEAAWLELAAARRWPELEALWRRHAIPIEGAPVDGAVALIQNGPAGLGLAVVIEDGLLMVHHRRGVVWVPLRLLRIKSFYRLA